MRILKKRNRKDHYSKISIGQKYNRLTVLEFAYSKKYLRYFKVKCDCGTIKEVKGTLMITGQTKSCGCLALEVRTSKEGHTSFNHSYLRTKHNAASKNREFNLDFDYYCNLIIQDCVYCGEKAQPFNKYLKNDGTVMDANAKYSKNCIDRAWININTLDRKNNDLGYTEENAVPCCWTCNQLKSEFHKDKFLRQVEKISKFQKEKSMGFALNPQEDEA